MSYITKKYVTMMIEKTNEDIDISQVKEFNDMFNAKFAKGEFLWCFYPTNVKFVEVLDLGTPNADPLIVEFDLTKYEEMHEIDNESIRIYPFVYNGMKGRNHTDLIDIDALQNFVIENLSDSELLEWVCNVYNAKEAFALMNVIFESAREFPPIDIFGLFRHMNRHGDEVVYYPEYYEE